MLPGSGLKGLAAHYAHKIWGSADETWRMGGIKHLAVFGNTSVAGHAQFEDGWILPESLSTCLHEDVMTPHHGDYYMADAGDTATAPTDFDDPNPVTYLSVMGAFRVVVEWDALENSEGWCRLVLGLLVEAMCAWGVGGKTSSGYGRLVR
jgi:CRISPR-associated protein Cmr6